MTPLKWRHRRWTCRWAQQELDQELGPTKLRRAIVVPNSRLAYLARLAFGEGEYRVFYNDIVSAVKWLAD
jgi:hypothetical protein